MTNLREDDKYFHGNFRRIFLHPSRRSSFPGVLGVGVQIHQGQLLYQLGSFDECAIRTVLHVSLSLAMVERSEVLMRSSALNERSAV